MGGARNHNRKMVWRVCGVSHKRIERRLVSGTRRLRKRGCEKETETNIKNQVTRLSTKKRKGHDHQGWQARTGGGPKGGYTLLTKKKFKWMGQTKGKGGKRFLKKPFSGQRQKGGGSNLETAVEVPGSKKCGTRENSSRTE